MNPTLQASYALSRPVVPTKTPTTLDLLLTFRSERPTHGPGARLPLNLSVVIDRSGSMSGKPLQKAIAAAEVLIEHLRPDDTVSVVAFCSTVDTVLPPQPVTDVDEIRKAVRKIRVGGATNLHGGWAEGCKHVHSRRGGRLVNRVLLLTDGAANAGVTEPKKLIALAKAEAEKGVQTTTLGFGRDFAEDLLIGMAEASGGNFYFIETPDEATQVFQIEGETLSSIAARDLHLGLTPAAGVTLREVLNALPAERVGDTLRVAAGDVYTAEDKLIAVELEVAAQPKAKKGVPLVEVAYVFEPAAGDGGRESGELAVTAEVGKADAPADAEVVRRVAPVRVARSKERAVALSDAGDNATAATTLRGVAAELRSRDLDEEFEFAEEVMQLEYFADTIEAGRLDATSRKVLRDQSYQGRTRNRADLTARGGAGGSAQGLPTTDAVGSGVEVRCLRDGGKLKVVPVSDGYERDFRVLLPRGVREENVHYVVDRLEPSKNGTFYRAGGTVRRLTKPTAGPAGDLKLDELFAGGGEPWLPLLKPVIEARPEAAAFIGPARASTIVPVRELTFQALKPNPPEKWKVVVFGQNPYPRVESATGIAMFDNTFADWADGQFGKVTSIRCIIKAAAMWKHRIPKATPIADIRALLKKEQTVQPPEWFQAMLSQGVLLLNASLTASSDGGLSTDQHTAFWRPVVERLVEEVFKAKAASADPAHKGVVFGWWGTHAKLLRKVVERLQKSYPGVPTRHIDHPNPAAQGDIFCDGDHFGAVNAALESLNMAEVDWLPAVGWNQAAGDADRMGAFITQTMELHKFYLERLQEVRAEPQEALAPVAGVLAGPAVTFADAIGPLAPAVAGLEYYAKRAVQFAQQAVAKGEAEALTADEVAAVFLYTTETAFYRKLNAALREPDRGLVTPYFGYLRLLLTALGKLTAYAGSLWRGVALDMRKQYPKGGTVTWWGVSSCTAKKSVATGFIGSKGKRTLFEVVPARAVGIRRFSAFTGEDEYLLAPGTRLTVADVKAEPGGLCTIRLEEQAGERLVT